MDWGWTDVGREDMGSDRKKAEQFHLNWEVHKLNLQSARAGREEKPNTPQKCEKRRSGGVRGGGCSHSIHVTSLPHFLSLSLSPRSQGTSAGRSPFPLKPVHTHVSLTGWILLTESVGKFVQGLTFKMISGSC